MNSISFIVATLIFSSHAWACSPPGKSLCDLDRTPYLYKFEPEVKTTLPAGIIKASQRTTHYDFAREQFEINFDLKSDLYTLEKPESKEQNIATPFEADGSYFHVSSKIRKRGQTSCKLDDKKEPNLKNLADLDWNCDEIRTSCEEVENPNFMVIKPYQFKFASGDVDFPASPKKLKPETSKLKKYVYYNDQIHSLEFELKRIPNPNYLKMNCPSEVKITSCGKSCRHLHFADTRTSSDQVKKEAIKGKSTVEFTNSKSKFHFEYSIIPGNGWNRDYYVEELKRKFSSDDYNNSMRYYNEISDEALDAVLMQEVEEYIYADEMTLKVKRLK
jgi:hypothetical protein